MKLLIQEPETIYAVANYDGYEVKKPFAYILDNKRLIFPVTCVERTNELVFNINQFVDFKNRECVFEIKDLKEYDTYSGLRYNGVDYECSQVLCGVNQYNAEILAFITNDGEIIDINDKMLNGVFLIEGDTSKKFNSQFLISPYEVEAPYIEGEDFEEQFYDERTKHAFGNWEIIEQKGSLINHYHFLTHNAMQSFLQEKCGVSDELVKELPEAQILSDDVSGSITLADNTTINVFGSPFSFFSKNSEKMKCKDDIISTNKRQRRR